MGFWGWGGGGGKKIPGLFPLYQSLVRGGDLLHTDNADFQWLNFLVCNTVLSIVSCFLFLPDAFNLLDNSCPKMYSIACTKNPLFCYQKPPVYFRFDTKRFSYSLSAGTLD